ncbi:MAG: PKD domain-containing protein, partial [Bacteroidota bacterium]
MLKFRFASRAACSLVILFIYLTPLSAQLTADFYPDKQGACPPFTVTFSNNSSGASPAAVYEWDFGNGNRSSLKDPSAVFQQEKNYSVTLTVKDGGKTATQTRTITGYRKPTVNFSASLTSGCTPLPVSFTSTSTAADGSITDYFWDFGDGYTQQSGSPQITHTYQTAQKPPVILAVTDNHGCTSSKLIDNLFEVLPGVTADFSATDNFICFVTDPVQLKDMSTGFTDKLVYNWEFGDGKTSKLRDPIYVFNTKGTYTVKLAVQNSVGCKSESVKSAFLHVGNFKSEITAPAFACNNQVVEIKNTSFPAPTSFSWLIDGSSYVYEYNGKYTYQFTTPGKHTIQLTNNFGNCKEVITKEIEIRALPEPAPFIANIPFHCAGPVTVAFHDTTKGVVKSEWNFQRLYYPLTPEATGKDVSYTFTQEHFWRVTLFVTDAHGCSNSREQEVKIIYPHVNIRAIDTNRLSGCMSLTKQFEIETTETLASFSWDFENGRVSTDPRPTITFTERNPLVKLNYLTDKGCKAASYFYDLVVFPKPKAEFVSISGTTICGNTRVTFETPQVNYWDYYMIDGVFAGTSNYTRMDHQFLDTGLHTVSLVVYNDACRDTLTRTDYIRVVPSFPKISTATNTCDGDRGRVTFTQASRYAEKWVWDFGDNSPLVTFDTDKPTITHDYKKSGKYKVVLATIAGSCTVKDSMFVYVQVKRIPVLSATSTTACQDQGIAYSLTNIDPLAYDGIWVWAYVDRYEYNDGTTVPVDTYNYWDNWIHTDPYLSTFKPLQKDKTAFRIIMTQPYFGCSDTSNFLPVKVAGAIAGFQITGNNGCYKPPVVFNDTSQAYNSKIISRLWTFGDGQTLTTTQSGIVTHNYAAPGAYNVSLKITDDGGCSSTTSFSSQVATVNGPKAIFSASGTNVQLNTSVQFYNNSNTYNSSDAVFSWQFGDGSTSVEFSPTHTFIKAGTYQVRLIAQSDATGCRDTTFEQITVKDFQVAFSYQQSFILNGKCPPTLFRFYNNSTNYTHLEWDFGDGNVAENVVHPSHLYTEPGEYTVQLYVKGYNGLTDVFKEIITVRKAVSQLAADLLHSCTAQSITLNTNKLEGHSYSWDFGDGTLINNFDTIAAHQYQKAGVYLPSLLVTDNAGCATAVTLADKIVIDSLNISLGDIPQSICAPRSLTFNPQIVNIAADQAQQTLTYQWDFGTGNMDDTANTKNPGFNFQQAGSYVVRLTVKSPYGCEKQVQSTIQVLQGLGAQMAGPARICEGATA